MHDTTRRILIASLSYFPLALSPLTLPLPLPYLLFTLPPLTYLPPSPPPHLFISPSPLHLPFTSSPPPHFHYAEEDDEESLMQRALEMSMRDMSTEEAAHTATSDAEDEVKTFSFYLSFYHSLLSIYLHPSLFLYHFLSLFLPCASLVSAS